MNSYRIEYTEIKPGNHHDRQCELVRGDLDTVRNYLDARAVYGLDPIVGTPQAVETLGRETRGILAEQERRTARRMHNPAVVAEATRILDSIADLDGLATIVSLRAELAA